MPLGDKIRQLDEKAANAVRRAVDDLREDMGKRFEEAAAEMRRHLGEAAPDLPASFFSEEEVRRIAEEEMAPTSQALDGAREAGRQDLSAALLAAYAELDRAGSQSEILDALLSASERFAPRAAILLVRGEKLAAWGGRGFDAGPETIRALSLPADAEPWGALVAGGASRRLSAGRCGALVSQLDSALPSDGAVVPLLLRDRVAALLYADRERDDEALELEALQCLTYTAAFALETLAFRQRDATATLAPAAETADGAPPAAPEPEPSSEEPAADTAEAGALDETTELASSYDVEPDSFEDAPAEEPPAAHGFVEDTVVEDAVTPTVGWRREEPEELELDTEELAGVELEVEEPPAATTPPHGDELLQPVEMEDEEPALGEEASPDEPAAPADAEIPWQTDEEEPDTARPVGFQPDADVAARPTEAIEPREAEVEEAEVQEAEVEEVEVEEEADEAEVEEEAEVAESAPPAASTEVVPPPPAPTFSGQVEPPDDVEGPGWAFSATRNQAPETEDASHGEARRLARLLVSEIQLYNQEEVEEGRRHRDVYERLKDDIERSRKLYDERVDPAVRDSTDYFYQELVRQLGAGDARALGI